MARRAKVVTIVGGGASGLLTALHVLDRVDAPTRVVVVEPRAELGRGVAYGTTNPEHLLNTRAGCMSAYPDRPGHFAEWARRSGVTGADDFLPRSWFGDYLQSLVGAVEHVRAEAVDVLPHGDGAKVVLANGSVVPSDHVVLAPGPSPQRWPAPLRHRGPRWIGDPWARGALAALRPGDPVLLVGTGLTAVDIALELAGRGHDHIVAVSRHGLLPLAHDRLPAAPTPRRPEGVTLDAVFSWARETAGAEGDWRPVVDSLRGATDALWNGFSDIDRRRFLRHLHRRWEVVRHRMPPEVADRIRSMQSADRLTVLAGGVRSARTTRRGVTVELSDRTLRASAVVNCTGPAPEVRLTNHHLVRELLHAKVVRPGPLGLGLESDPDGSIPGTDGRMWLIGPLRRGGRWEVTAVPDISGQATQIAGCLTAVAPVVAGRP